MKVLVAAASKHGATAEIADAIGQALTEHRLDTTVAASEQVDSIDG